MALAESTVSRTNLFLSLYTVVNIVLSYTIEILCR